MDSTSNQTDKIVDRQIEDEMRTSYLDYAMSVLVSRALPDVRDGLKPVQRRILYTMYRLGLLHNKPFRKSANIIGNTMARYHPHGDSAIYDSLVRMAQNFSLRYPLVDGQGNWGSIDGDKAAAHRYTEARLRHISEEILSDIDKDTVNFVPNYDGSAKEPSVLPAKVPNLLVNGSTGIAVGMATSIPPHNLTEVSNAIIAQIDDPEITVDEIMKHIPGPDFPTGGIIRGRMGILSAYTRGRGLIKVRSKTSVEESKDKQSIIVSEIPYQVNKSLLMEEMADLVKNKVVPDISDLRDESDRNGIRVVIELKKYANPTVVLNQLFSHSRLESTFPIALVALINNRPSTLGIKRIIRGYIEHQIDVITRRCKFELNKAQERQHIVQGLITALDSIDGIVKLIKSSKDAAAAKAGIIEHYSLSEKQAIAVLDMRLQKLSSLEQQTLRDEGESLAKTISELAEILASPQKIKDIVKTDLRAIRDKFSDKRRSEISEDESEPMIEEDLITPQDVVVTISHTGYAKRTSLSEYKQQHRGGRGVMAASTKEDDFVEHLFVANTHSYILLFTNKGIVHWLKVYNIPEAGRIAKGKALVNLLNLSEGENVTAFVPVKEFKEGNLVMATRNGTIKKTDLSAYSNPRRGGIIAITLEEKDELISVSHTSGDEHIILATKNGSAVRFKESDIRNTGRSAKGVRGIKLRDDAVIGMVVADETKTLLTVCEKGYGKRTPISDYRLITRGGFGVINIQTSERNGQVIAIESVADEDELMLISRQGIIIRVPAKDISVIGRSTQGARLMRMGSDDSVVAVAKVFMEN